MNETPVRYDATTPPADRPAARALDRGPDADAARDLHGEAPLRRGMERGRHLARRPGLGRHGALRAARDGALHRVRVLRRRLLERVGLGERAAPADDPRVRDERQPDPRRPRRAAAAVLTDQARLQAHQVSRVDEIHRPPPGRLLGGSGVPVVRRFVALALFAAACGKNRPMADKAEMPSTDSTAMMSPARMDSMLDTMPGGEMVRGNDSAAMRLLKKKAARR